MTLMAVAVYWPSGSMLGLSGAVLCLLSGRFWLHGSSAGLGKRGTHGRSANGTYTRVHVCGCGCIVSEVALGDARACLCGRRVRLPNILEGITDSIWDGRHLNLSLQFAGPDLGDVTKIL